MKDDKVEKNYRKQKEPFGKQSFIQGLISREKFSYSLEALQVFPFVFPNSSFEGSNHINIYRNGLKDLSDIHIPKLFLSHLLLQR